MNDRLLKCKKIAYKKVILADGDTRIEPAYKPSSVLQLAATVIPLDLRSLSDSSDQPAS